MVGAAPPGLKFGSLWMTTRQEFFKTLEIASCGGFKVLLSETTDNVINDKYVVIFGDGSPTK